MILAFMGNDGSGKTTTRQLICRELEEKGIRVRVIPGFDHFILECFKHLIGFLFGLPMVVLQEDYSDGKKSKPGNSLFSMVFKLWPYFVFLDCLLILVSVCLERRKLIIFDRYFYDHAVAFEELGYSSKFVRALFLLFPKPDVGFVFDAEPEVAYSRKKHDHSAPYDYYRRQRERYLCLAREKRLPVVNTTHCSPGESLNLVREKLTDHPGFKMIMSHREIVHKPDKG